LGYFLLDIFFYFFFVRTIIITHIHAPKKDIISYHSAKKDMYTYPVFYPKSNLQFPTSSPIAGAHNNAAAAAATTTSKFRGWTYHFLEDIISYHSAKKDMYTYPVFYPKSNLQFPTSSPIAGAHNNAAAAAAATTTSKFRGWTYHFLEDIISYPYLGPQKGYYIQLLELTTWSHDDFG
jgi:hypothetical protein